jgi:hypothetical protein
LAVVAPAATATEPGTVNALLLSDTATDEPPAGAAWDNVTVQVEVPPDVTVVGVHWSAETETVEGTLIVPPVPAMATLYPEGNTPITLLSGIVATLPLVADTVAVTTATTPFPIALAFMPLARQVREPLLETQLSVLPAPVRAGPATALKEAISVGA